MTVCADVKFFKHDIVHRMWNGDKIILEKKAQFDGKIEIDDNAVIGGNSIILYNIHIGNSALIAAGSVVTKDVEPYSIVGEKLQKRLETQGSCSLLKGLRRNRESSCYY